MSYKPKFCCECGEKIERIDWKLWTSRRFCKLCETDHILGEKLQIGLVVAGVVFGLMGLASFWQRTEKPPPLTAANLISGGPSNKNKTEVTKAPVSRTVSAAENSSVQPLAQMPTTNSAIETQAETQISTTQDSAVRQTNPEQKSLTPDEATYFCGARTKNGTACSRRVKGGGRCWQHLGKPAILAQEKLIVSK